MPINNEERALLRRLCAGATPGPWTIAESFHGDAWEVRAPYALLPVCTSVNEDTADLEFIIAARALLPRLLAALEEADAE